MASVPDGDASLRLYYDQVINTHMNLAVVLSDVAGTVVDGRIPNHDLPKMLRDLAEREGIMADNWTLVRDGLFNKTTNDDTLGATDMSTAMRADNDEDEAESPNRTSKNGEFNRSAGQEGRGQPELSKSDQTRPIWWVKRPAARERRLREDTYPGAQPGAQPQTDQEAKSLSKKQLKKIRLRLMQAQQVAKTSGNPEKVRRAIQSGNKLQSTLQQQDTLRKLEEKKRQDAEVNRELSAGLQKQQEAKVIKDAKKAEPLARAAITDQEKQEKEERRVREAAELLERQRRKAERLALHYERMQEAKEKKTKRIAEKAARQERMIQQQSERKARLVAGKKTRDAASSFPLPQRSLPPFTYETNGFTIKQEVIEPEDI